MTETSSDDAALFTVVSDDQTAVVSVHRSELTDDDNIEQFGQQLFSLVEKRGCRRIVVNLAGVAYVTSSVVGKWITLHRKLTRSGGMLVLCSLNASLREILETSRLLSYFNIASSVDSARRDFPVASA